MNVVENSESSPVRFVVSSFVSDQNPFSSVPTRISFDFALSAGVAAAGAVAHVHAVGGLVRVTENNKTI